MIEAADDLAITVRQEKKGRIMDTFQLFQIISLCRNSLLSKNSYKAASAAWTQARIPFQSRSDSRPTAIGCAAGGRVAKKLRNVDGSRRPAADES